MALKRALTLLAVLLALAGGPGLVWSGWRWSQVERYNAALAAGDYRAAGELDLPQGVFARAYALQQQGRWEEALALYQRLVADGPTELAGAARYNMANAYLRQALKLDSEDTRDLMLPLAELAKTAYRERLRDDSRDWDAKYNLERALQLLPDPREQEDNAFLAPERGPQAVITIQTDPQGLP